MTTIQRLINRIESYKHLPALRDLGCALLGCGSSTPTAIAHDVTRTVQPSDWIDEQLQALLSRDGITRQPWDAQYWCCSQADFEAILDDDLTDLRIYQGDSFDCENYALEVANHFQSEAGLNSVGLVNDYSSAHMYNVVVFSNGDVALFEPQEDRYVTPGEVDLHQFEHVEIML